MRFDFYYGDESEQYSFYSVPKMFFDNDKFKDLSAMSKLLYSFLLDRMSLSKRRNLSSTGRKGVCGKPKKGVLRH